MNARKLVETLVTVPLLVVAFMAPVHAIVLLVLDAGGRPDAHPLAGSWLNLPVAAAGLFLGFLGARMVLSLYSELRTLDRLSVSRVSDAGLGLQEFRGVARVLPRSVPLERGRGPRVADLPPPDPAALLEHARLANGRRRNARDSERWIVRRFFLEDSSGRILIDPEGSRPWNGSGSPFWERYCKVLLTRRRRRTDLGPEEYRETVTLLDGDPVHLLGWVVRDPEAPADAAGPARYLVRPSARARDEAWAFAMPEADLRRPMSWAGDLTRLVWHTAFRWIRGEEPRDVFILSDAEEVRIRGQYIRAIRTASMVVLAWILFPAWLVKDTVLHAPYRDWAPAQVASHAPEEDRGEVLDRATRSERPQTRAEAVAALAKANPAEVTRVVESLADPDARVRRAAIGQLRTLSLSSASPDLQKRLLENLTGGEPEVVSALLPLLPRTGIASTALAPALQVAFDRAQGQTALRLEIAEAQVAHGRPEAAPIVRAILDSMASSRGSESQQFRARALLHRAARSDPGTVGAELARELAGGDEPRRIAAALALSSLGPAGREARPALLEAAERHPTPQVRVLALRSFRATDPNDAEWPALALRKLSDESPEVRREALDLLAVSPPRAMDAEAAAALGSMAGGPAPVDRQAAQRLLRLGGREAVRAAAPTLVAALRIGRDASAWSAARPLLTQAGDAALPALVEAARDDHAVNRRHAVESLGYLGPSALPALRDLAARDSDAQVRWAAEAAVVRLTPSEPPSPPPSPPPPRPASRPRVPSPVRRSPAPSIPPAVVVNPPSVQVRMAQHGWMRRAPSTREPQVIPIVTAAEWEAAKRSLGLAEPTSRFLDSIQRDHVLFLVTGGVKQSPGARVHITTIRRRNDVQGLVFGIYEETPDRPPSNATAYPYVLIALQVKDVLPVHACVDHRQEDWPARIHASFRIP